MNMLVILILKKYMRQKRFVEDIIIYLDKKKLLLTRSQRREKNRKNKCGNYSQNIQKNLFQ